VLVTERAERAERENVNLESENRMLRKKLAELKARHKAEMRRRDEEMGTRMATFEAEKADLQQELSEAMESKVSLKRALDEVEGEKVLLEEENRALKRRLIEKEKEFVKGRSGLIRSRTHVTNIMRPPHPPGGRSGELRPPVLRTPS
jgi:predicted  nucleic acid-binding Zn-ribbon protein